MRGRSFLAPASRPANRSLDELREVPLRVVADGLRVVDVESATRIQQERRGESEHQLGRDEQFVLGPGDYLHGRVAVLRRGRRNLAAARQR